jgi:internalin A
LTVDFEPIHPPWNRRRRIATRWDSQSNRPSFDEPCAGGYDEHASALRSQEAGMDNQAKPVSRPWRRFLRFSVRGLIVLVLLIGAGLAWVARNAGIQREAVGAIQRVRGDVFYDWEMSDGDYDIARTIWAPRYLVDFFGVDYFGHVTAVELLSSSSPTDEVLSQVGRLRDLEKLRIRDVSLSDVGLAQLEQLTKLTSLDLSGTHLTDAGLAHLRGLTGLAALDISTSQVTDAGLVHLNGLVKLSSLRLNDTHVSDVGLAHLKGLKNLSYLDLNGTRVTDVGVQELQQALPDLRIINR